MSKFHLSQDLTTMISNAVEAFALRLEKECKVSKDTVLAVWEQCSDDIVTSNNTPVLKKVKKEEKKLDAPTVQKLVKSDMPERRFALRKNQFGNYEHKETGFVFDPMTKSVFGKQVGDQVRTQLSFSDVELCKQFGFKFTMPEKFNEEVPENEDRLSDVEEVGMPEDGDEDD